MKPVIRVYQIDGQFVYRCEKVDKAYGKGVIRLEAIFYVLKILYYLEKDENGQYIHTK